MHMMYGLPNGFIGTTIVWIVSAGKIEYVLDSAPLHYAVGSTKKMEWEAADSPLHYRTSNSIEWVLDG